MTLMVALGVGLWGIFKRKHWLYVAVALVRLGRPTALIARLSTGAFGRRLRAHAERNGVDLAYAQSATEPATLAAVALADDGAATYDFYLEGTADWRWSDAGPVLPPGTRLVHTGSLATVVEPGASRIHTLLQAVHAGGTTIISYDPNVRPRLFAPDRAAAEQSSIPVDEVL